MTTELAVIVVDKTHLDAYVNQEHLKRGDVIDVLPGGSDWGREGRTHAWWTVLRVIDLSLVEARAMTSAEVGSRLVDPVLHARAFYLDFNKFPSRIANLMGDGSARLTEVVEITLAEFRDARTQKLKAKDPFKD